MATKKKEKDEVPEYTNGGVGGRKLPKYVVDPGMAKDPDRCKEVPPNGKLPEVKIEARPLTDDEAKELEKAIADSPVMTKGGLEAEFEKEYGWIAPNNVAGLYKAMLKELFFIRKGIENGK